MGRANYPDLAGAAVIITGGASGIGRAMAEAFLAQGSKVGILDIASNAISELRAGAAEIEAEQVDLRDITATQLALDRLQVRTGPARILINNAAQDARHTLESLSVTEWDDRMAVNLRHVMFVTQAVLPSMRRAGTGAVLNLGSTSWMKGATNLIAYVTAKSALAGFTRALSREVGADGIRVNALAPGWVMTDRQLSAYATPERRAANLAQQAIKREIAPSDIADAALFLCSECAGAITGQTLIVDGGMSYG